MLLEEAVFSSALGPLGDGDASTAVAPALDVAEVEAFRGIVESLMRGVGAPSPVFVHIPWTENDYQVSMLVSDVCVRRLYEVLLLL